MGAYISCTGDRQFARRWFYHTCHKLVYFFLNLLLVCCVVVVVALPVLLGLIPRVSHLKDRLCRVLTFLRGLFCLPSFRASLRAEAVSRDAIERAGNSGVIAKLVFKLATYFPEGRVHPRRPVRKRWVLE